MGGPKGKTHFHSPALRLSSHDLLLLLRLVLQGHDCSSILYSTKLHNKDDWDEWNEIGNKKKWLLSSLCFFLCCSSALQSLHRPMKTQQREPWKSSHDTLLNTINSCISDSLSLSVDEDSLQKQIDELSPFSITPAPLVTRILYSDKDVIARRNHEENENNLYRNR